MSFNRINPGGWAQGGNFTSSQANQMDIDHANALDKTVAGDTLSGVVTMAATGGLTVGVSGANIALSIGSAMTVGVSAGLVTTIQGGIQLGGGSADYPVFSPTRTRSLVIPMIAYNGFGPAAWTQNTVAANTGYMALGPGTAAYQSFMMPTVHNGAKLASISVQMAVGASHMPQNFPQISVFRVSAGGSLTPVTLAASDPQTPITPANGGAWWANGNQQGFQYTCNQNNIIDNTQYLYYYAISDENGSNARSGNQYVGTVLTFTGISDMRFST